MRHYNYLEMFSHQSFVNCATQLACVTNFYFKFLEPRLLRLQISNNPVS